MKSTKKVLASALALAMVVTAVPAVNAEAASAKLPSKKTYYVGKTKTLKLTLPKSYKKVSTKWSTSKKAVAKLSSKKAKSVKVKAVKAGKATVKAKVTFTKAGKKSTKTYSCKVTVKNPSFSAASAQTITVNEKVSYAATAVKPSSATIAYTSDNTEVATVDAAGEVTGVKAGTAKITATLTYGTETVETTTDVTVKKVALESVAQKKLKVLSATVKGDIKGLKTSDFTVTDPNGTVFPVSKVEADEKTNTVTLTMLTELKDAREYKVTLDGVEKTFVASNGEVESLAVDKITVPAGTETTITLQGKDANGVIVKELTAADNDNNYKITLATSAANGYVDGGKIYLAKVGDTAKATLTYTSLKYGTDGKLTKELKEEVTITAVDAAAVDSIDFKIGSDTKSYGKLKARDYATEEETSVAAFFKILDTDKKEISTKEYSAYTLESSDTSVLMLKTSKFTFNPGPKVGLTPVKAGKAYIILKKGDTVVGSKAVTVNKKRTVSSLELNAYNVTKSINLGENAKFKATLKDQYGDEINAYTPALTYEVIAAPAQYTKADYATLAGKIKQAGTNNNEFEVVIGTTGLDVAGTYQIKVSKPGTSLSKVFSLTLVSATGAVNNTFKLDISAPTVKVDVNLDDVANTFKNKATTIRAIRLDASGREVDVTSGATFKITKGDTTIYDSKLEANGTTVTTVSSAAIVNTDADKELSSDNSITVNAFSTNANETEGRINLEAGTYTVVAKWKNITQTGTFTVVIPDELATPVVDVKSVYEGAGSVKDVLDATVSYKWNDVEYVRNHVAPQKEILIETGSQVFFDTDTVKKDLDNNITTENHVTIDHVDVGVWADDTHKIIYSVVPNSRAITIVR